MERKSSCGCLGSVTVSPIFTLLFDVVATAMLLRFRPQWRGWPVNNQASRVLFRTAAVSVLLIGGLISWAYIAYGSIGIALAAARGKPIAVDPNGLELGLIQAGAQVERSLRVVNLSDETIQVHLAASDCACAEVSGLPVTLSPGKSVELPVTITAPRAAGTFRRNGRLRTTVGEVKYTISAVVWGSAVPATGQSP